MIQTRDQMLFFLCKVNFSKQNYICTNVFEVTSRHYTWLLNSFFFIPPNRGRHFFPLCMFYLYCNFDRWWEEFEGNSLEVWITILYSFVFCFLAVFSIVMCNVAHESFLWLSPESQRYAVFCLFRIGAEVFDTEVTIVDEAITDICFENVIILWV